MLRWPALTVRKRIFGGFAIVLALLALLAGVALHSMNAMQSGAQRVSQYSAQAAVATELATQVEDAHSHVVRYALSGTISDQMAALSSLRNLDDVIARAVDGNGQASEVRAVAQRYRSALDRTIEVIETRRAGIEQLQVAATELRTINSALVQALDREVDPPMLVAGAHLAETFGAADAAAARFLATRTPAEANTATGALQSLRRDAETLTASAAGNRRILRFQKAASEPTERFAEGLQRVLGADEKLRAITTEREAAAAAVLRLVSDDDVRARQAQATAVGGMLSEAHSAYRLSLVASAGAIGAGILLAYLIGRGIARPVQRLTNIMRQLANGTLDVVIP